MDSESVKNRLLKRRQSSEILVEQRSPHEFEQGTKVFVVGPPRSGTTLIYSLIAAESFSPECTFVSNLMKLFDETFKFGDEERFEYYAHNLTNLVEIFKKPVYDFLYMAALKVGGVSKNRFFYKDPMLTLYLDYFPLFFGDSYKIVFCYRDPRDVVTSMFNVLKKKNTGEDAGVLFDKAIDFIFPFYRIIYELDQAKVNIDLNKLVFVKFEDIVTDNTETVQELEKFLGLTIDLHRSNESIRDRLDETSPFYSTNYGKPITETPIGRYKDILTFEQIVRIEHLFSYYMDRLAYERMGKKGFIRFEPQKSLQQISSLHLELQKSKEQVSSLQLELQKAREEADSLRLVLARMPLALAEPTIEKTEQSIRYLNETEHSKDAPDMTMLFNSITKINMHLVAANLYLRQGRYKSAFSHLVLIGRKDPLIFFSVQTLKVLADGLLSHLRRP